ncbi:hypothetical protein CERZMDRAFT_81794 [Cercospora zeae-maydis SCOH1-5]|uniref:RRM domain-containing protein n=1 Tax=Cercospora zeae-maydis SCOH1-5 TaxID=717836 RepID=A0A6A6FR50_9PEZI|nr:hypothetical protein CERZMDRAFT_81794 [Cercospora zeae-maydis SCOH1-5]
MASLARSIAGRALHLRISPRPSNLGESREILRLISQFGEVEYFRNLKYDALPMPVAALVIFKSGDAATHCLKKCPIRFRLGRAPVQEHVERDSPARPVVAPAATDAPARTVSPQRTGGAWGLGQTRALSTQSSYTSIGRLPNPPARPPQIPFQPPPLPLLDSRIFQINAHPARAHFRDQINMAHYHGSFMLDTKSVAQTDLSRTVPLLGLSCINWKKEDQPWRVVDRQKAQERTGPSRRKSLKELYDEPAEVKATSREGALPE